MKKAKMKLVAYLIAASLVAFVASSVTVQANLISGDIGFSGSYTVDSPGNLSLATKFTSFTDVTVLGSATGDYAGTSGQSVTFQIFTFDPVTPPVIPLWTFTVGAVTYSFDATSMNVPFKNNNNVVIEGNGTAQITGFDSTPGFWNLTANKAGANFTFSSSASVTSVPDVGLTVALLGLALMGVEGLRRNLIK